MGMFEEVEFTLYEDECVLVQDSDYADTEATDGRNDCRIVVELDGDYPIYRAEAHIIANRIRQKFGPGTAYLLEDRGNLAIAVPNEQNILEFVDSLQDILLRYDTIDCRAREMFLHAHYSRQWQQADLMDRLNILEEVLMDPDDDERRYRVLLDNVMPPGVAEAWEEQDHCA